MSKGTEQLEDPGNLHGHERFWSFQRLGWGVILLLLAAAVAGVFGSGPLSTSQAGEEQGAFRVEYERFWRVKSPTPVRVHLRAPGGEREARIWIDRAYLSDARIEQMLPQPSKVELSGDRLTFFFAATGSGMLEVVFHLQFEKPGTVRARFGATGSPVSFRQFIFP